MSLRARGRAVSSKTPGSRGSPAKTSLSPGVKCGSGDHSGSQLNETVAQTSSKSVQGSEVSRLLQNVSLNEGRTAQRRGSMRRDREISPPMVTRPKEVQDSKKGSGGQTLRVISNHFRLIKTTDWSLFQYRVDFSPEEDRTRIRKALLHSHKGILGDAYMFDGSMLFTMRKLTMETGNLELFSIRDADKEKIRITIKYANELALGDFQYIQLFNIILRNCIDAMDFQLVGHEYFDPNLSVDLHNFKLSIWPGFVTSIRQFEDNIMMCLDVSHKVLRKDTVLEFMNECRHRYREEWQDKFLQAILGTVVFTHYNNKPYQVDDVDFNSNPCSTFKKGDQDMKYIDYYQSKYQVRIRDMNQPLLVSRPKAKDIRGGRNQYILLVPELCNLTGLSPEMRSNFQLMKAVADKTRIPPGERIKSYYQFMRRMNSNPVVKEKQLQWNLKFADKLEEIDARRFEPETLVQGEGKQLSYDDSGDWTRNLRGGSMFLSINLLDWAVLAPAKLGDRMGQGMVDNFLSELKKAARSLKFGLSAPQILFVEADKPSVYYSAIEQTMSRKELQLVMCIIPNNRADLYSSIKKKCCIDRPVNFDGDVTPCAMHPTPADELALRDLEM